jgi:hypothetical protein
MKLAWTSCVAVRAWGNFTAGRNLFPKKVRELLKHAGESVQKCARWLATSRASWMWATCMSAGKRLLYQPLTGTTEAQRVGVGRAAMGDVTPAG